MTRLPKVDLNAICFESFIRRDSLTHSVRRWFPNTISEAVAATWEKTAYTIAESSIYLSSKTKLLHYFDLSQPISIAHVYRPNGIHRHCANYDDVCRNLTQAFPAPDYKVTSIAATVAEITEQITGHFNRI